MRCPTFSDRPGDGRPKSDCNRRGVVRSVMTTTVRGFCCRLATRRPVIAAITPQFIDARFGRLLPSICATQQRGGRVVAKGGGR